MSLFIASLNSGSNGNCYYIGNSQEAVLVDVGISCREVERRMARLGLAISQVKAIFISHEHGDHIRGLCRLTAKYQIPVYISGPTLEATGFCLNPAFTHLLRASVPIQMGNLRILPFPKFHDAADPYSFVIEGNGTKVGVFTDIGRVCDQITHYFSQCHAVFLEANYDEEMLANGRYPYFLKRRIQGGYGHLSNTQALELFLTHRTEQLSHLFLSHLSKDNNCPELAARLFKEHTHKTEIVVASREEETAVYEITANQSLSLQLSIQLADLFTHP